MNNFKIIIKIILINDLDLGFCFRTLYWAMAVAGKRLNHCCDPCHYVEKTVEAVGFCSECVEYLCPDCIKYHKKIKATREHILYTGDLPAETSSFERIKSMMKCLKHSDLNIAYLCSDHSEHICITCARESHMTCSIADITALVNREKSAEQIRRYLSETRVSEINMIQQEIQNNLLTLSEEKNHALEKRNQLIDLLRKTIENLEQSCSMIEMVFTETTDSLREKHKKYVNKSDETKELKSFLETMLNFGTAFHMYLAANSIQIDNIENGCREDFNEIYCLEDSVGSNTPHLLQTLSTMSFNVALTQNKPVKKETNNFNSTDPARETEELTHLSDKRLEGIKASQIPPSDTLSETPSDELPILPQTKYKTTTLRTNTAGMTLHKIFLEGPGFKGEDLDVAATDAGVVVIALRHSGSVLFFDNTFTLIKLVTLPYEVLGVCCIDKDRIAIVWSDKRIRKYAIVGNGVRMYNDFTLSLNCCCISGHGKKIICLYVAGILDEHEAQKRQSVYIEIRDHFSGTICAKTPLEMATSNKSLWTVFSLPSTSEILISNGETVKVISETGRELREIHQSGIISISGDKIGNVCMFQKPGNMVVMLPKGSQQVNTYRVQKLAGAAMTYCKKFGSWVLVGFRMA